MAFPMFSRAPLALAVAGALTLPAHASLPDSSTPTLSLKTLDASVRQFSGFDVAILPGARFAVVWAEYDGTSESRIWLRRYDERGTPEANAVILASNSGDTLAAPTVVADNDGTLWVSWGATANADYVSGAACHADMAMVRVDPNDTVTAVTTPATPVPVCTRHMDVNAQGNAVLAWSERDTAQLDEPLVFTTYDRNGSALAGPIQVAGDVDFGGPVALNDDGTLLAAWEDQAVVFGQRFNLNGDPVDSGARRLDQNKQSGASLVQKLPSVSDDAEGGFVAAWNQDDIIADDPAFQRTVRAQRWAADGTADDTLLLYNEEYDFSIDYSVPRVATDSAGNLAAVWVSRNGNQPQAARGTVITAAGEVIGERGTRFADFSDIDVMRATGDPKVALNDELAVVAWQGTAGDQAVLRAKVTGNALSGGDDNDSAQNSFDHDNGGAAGLLSLLGLGLLRLRRRSRR